MTKPKRTLSREMSRMFSGMNKVDIDRLLSSIHVFHEVLDEEYGGLPDHPYIHLHPDGSGGVYATRHEKCLFNFVNLESLVRKADELMNKYGIEWVD